MARLPEPATLGDLGLDWGAMFSQGLDYAKKAGTEAVQASVQKRIAETQAKAERLKAEAAATRAALAAKKAPAPAAAPAAVAFDWATIAKPVSYGVGALLLAAVVLPRLLPRNGGN